MNEKRIRELAEKLVDLVAESEGLGARQAEMLCKKFEAEIAAATRPWWKRIVSVWNKR